MSWKIVRTHNKGVFVINCVVYDNIHIIKTFPSYVKEISHRNYNSAKNSVT